MTTTKPRTLALAGLLASLALAAFVPELGRTPLQAALVMLPAAAALLGAVRIVLRARPASAAERLLGAGWLVLALPGERLGLPLGGELLAGGLVLLLAWRVARLLPALVREAKRLAASRTGRWAWPFAAVPFAVGIALLPWVHRAAPPNGDEPYYLLLAESVVSEGDFDLADEYREAVSTRFTGRAIEPQPGDPVSSEGVQRSRHESLLVLYLVPFWVVGGAFACRLGIVLLWALLAERLVALARRAGVGARGTVLAWALASFSPPLAVYASQVWVEVPAALALAIALERWSSARAGQQEGRVRTELAFAAALLALPLLKLRLLAIAVPLAFLRLFDARSSGDRLSARRQRPVALVGLVAIAAIGAFVLQRNLRLGGRALGLYALSDFVTFEEPLAAYLLRLDGLLFDLAFGLIAAAPIWLLALRGLATREAWRSVGPAALLAAAPYLALVVSLRSWFGGWCPPFRYGVVLLPIFAIGLGFALAHRPGRRELLLGWSLGLATAAVALAVVVVPGWATSFADGRSRLVDLASAPFAVDLARLLPSSVRPRTASWLVPALALGVLAACSLRSPRRSRGRRLVAPELAACAALLTLCGATLAAAHWLPSRLVELEDPWISPGVGELYPELWTVDRPLYESGRALAPGVPAVEIPPIVGGERVSIRVVSRAHPENRESVVLVVSSSTGEELLRRELRPGANWRSETLAERAWAPGERLRIDVEASSPAPEGGAPGKAIVDRVELDWR